MRKRIFFCLMAVITLIACNNSSEQNNNGSTKVNEEPQTEMTAPEDDQDGWSKQSTIMSAKPMVVDFFATWCGPCKQLEPILAEVENNHKGDVIFQRIDVDQEPELAREFGIEAIPMLMFITPKGEYQTLVGLQDAAVIEEKIAQLLNRSAK